MRVVELMAAAKYVKGTRLLIKVKKEAYLGTVTTTRLGEVFIVLDNGDKFKVKEKSKLILGEGIKRQVKKAISLDNTEKYITESVDVLKSPRYSKPEYKKTREKEKKIKQQNTKSKMSLITNWEDRQTEQDIMYLEQLSEEYPSNYPEFSKKYGIVMLTIREEANYREEPREYTAITRLDGEDFEKSSDSRSNAINKVIKDIQR